MKSFILLLTVFLLTVVNSFSQTKIYLPKSQSNNNLKISEFETNYFENNQDTSEYAKSKKKEFERWLFINKNRLTIQNDSTYSFDNYSEAMKYIAETNLYCNNEDKSNWSNVGPRNVGQHNGWVEAVYMSPTDSNTILIGARIAGIFKTTNGGQNWVCVTDSMSIPILGVQQIISSPFNSDILLAITGNVSGLDAVQTGYLYSNDGGDTWNVGAPIGMQEHVKWMCFDKNISGRVYAVLNTELIYSNDNGQTWSGPLNLPLDLYADSVVNLDKVFVSNDKLFIINRSGEPWEDFIIGIWKGDVIGNITNINWGNNFALNLIQPPFLYISDTNISISYINETSYQNTYPFVDSTRFTYYTYAANISFGCTYDTTGGINYPYYNINDTANSNHSYNSYDWHRIMTNGWKTRDTINNVIKVSCQKTGNYSNVNYSNYDTEVLTLRTLTLPNEVIISDSLNPTIMDLNFNLPKGARFKVCFTPYKEGRTVTTSGTTNNNINHLPNWICNIPDFNYTTLFENVLYESEFSTINQNIDTIPTITFPSNIINSQIFENNMSERKWFYYFIIEFNDDYDTINKPKFVINRFDIRNKFGKPKMISVSNRYGVNNENFALHVHDPSYSTIYKTTNGGVNFTTYKRSQLSPSGGVSYSANFNKDELIVSESDDRFIYEGTLNHGLFKKETDTIISIPYNGGGHHRDYRSSYTQHINGTDFILFGNDGGVSLIKHRLEDSSSTHYNFNSINGDLSINMIYNLDVHEKTKKILIGMQDNGTRQFSANQQGWNYVYGNDGCIAMIRDSFPNQYIFNDPQFGSNVILEKPNFPPNAIVDDNFQTDSIKNGEPYLGMRLEEYRFDDTRFIAGLQKITSAPTGKIIINEGQNITRKVVIPHSKIIGAIAISQRNPNTIFLSDYLWKGDEDYQEKIYKTTNGGLNSSDWTPIDPYVTFTINGQTYQDSLSNYLQWDNVNAVAVDNINPDLVYIGMSGVGDFGGVVTHEWLRVMRSIDGGFNYTDWSEGLPALPVNYLLSIESENHLLFCATDAGIYYRTDQTTGWECFSNKLSKTRITDLSYNYCAKELYASSYGRGVWMTKVNIQTGSAFKEEITTNTTWNTDRNIQSDLVIKNGSTLNISNATITIDADRKIIIEPNARLILNDAILTNECGALWEGIEIWGETNAQQHSSNQGTLIMHQSIIENAHEAVRVWKPGDWNSTGGIIRATNSTFRNNSRDVEFIAYNWSLNGVEQPNTSYFENCNFITDSNFINTTVRDHVTLFKVYGVRFLNCDFADQRATVSANKGRGIFSMDAKYKVLGVFTGNTATVIPYFDDSNYDVCTFTNLKSGIEILNSNSQNTVAVDHVLFTDCNFGVRISQVDNAMITRNQFVRTSGTNSSWYSDQMNIYIDKSSAYQIEGNEMRSDNNTWNTFGTLIFNSGLEDNETYKNKFNKLTYASVSVGKNRNNAFDIPGASLKGLEFLCNSNIDNQVVDEYIFAFSNLDGAKLVQGSPQSNIPAGNTFSNLTQNNTYNIYSSLPNSVLTKYYWYLNDPLQEPSVVNGSVFSINTPDEYFCKSNFNIISPDPDRPILNAAKVLELENTFSELQVNYTKKKDSLNVLLANGDRLELHTAIVDLRNGSTDKTIVKNLLLTDTPYLSSGVLSELADVSPNNFPEDWLRDILLLNIEVMNAPSFSDYLLRKDTPMAQSNYDILMAARIQTTALGGKQMEIMEINRSKNRIANMLIKNIVLDTLGADVSSFEDWVERRSDVLKEVQLADFYLSKGDKTKSLLHLVNLSSQMELLAEGDLKTELQDYHAFKTEMIQLTDSSGTLRGLDSLTEVRVRFHAENAFGTAQVQAQNLLCFWLGECAQVVSPRIAPSRSLTSSSTPSTDSGDTENGGNTGDAFSIHPNPASETITITLTEELSKGELKIYALKGTLVLEQKIEQKSFAVNVSALEKGIYFVHILNNDSSVDEQKLIIQ